MPSITICLVMPVVTFPAAAARIVAQSYPGYRLWNFSARRSANPQPAITMLSNSISGQRSLHYF